VLFVLQQEQTHEAELVGGVFLAAQYRQLQFADEQVPHLVHQGEFGVGDREADFVHRQFRCCFALLRLRQQR